MASTFEFSIVIPSYNGANKLVGLLQELTLFKNYSFEIIVVLDGSTDNSVQIITSFKEKFPTNSLNYILTPNRGRACTRNTGVSSATSEIIFFLDDDMLPKAQFFKHHLDFHLSFPNSIGTGVLFEPLEEMKTDFQRYKYHLSIKWQNNWDKSKPTRMDKSNLAISAANLSMPKALFYEISGFDENLRDIEDYEFGLRALQSGIPIYYLPSALAVHRDFTTCKGYIKRQIEYKSERSKVLKKHNLIDSAKPTNLKKSFYWLFSFSVWVTAIDKESQWLLVLPQKFRYKIYDWVLWSQSQYFPPKA